MTSPLPAAYSGPGPYGGSNSVGSAPVPGSSASVTCQGAITATFTWRPAGLGDNPPKTVILEEISTAGWSGWSVMGPQPTGNASAGLPPDPSQQSGPTNPGDSEHGLKWSVKANPGQSFTTTCTPTANVNVTSGPQPGPPPQGAAGVWYTAQAWPVILGLTGTTKDNSGGDNILIGQGCTGSLSAGPATLSNFQWSVPDETYKSFDMAADQSWGHMTPVPANEWSLPNPHWYWKHGDDNGKQETVSCTALAIMNGHSIGSVSGEHEVNLWNPHVQTKDVELGPVSADGLSTIMAGTPPGAQNQQSGFWMQGAVATPSLFTSSGTGIWAWLQLCFLYRDYGPLGEGTKMTNYNLDSAFPYNTVTSNGDTPGGTKNAGVWGFIGTTLPFDAFTDSPSLTFYPFSDDVDISDSFRLYIMYLPQNIGSGSDWVPLLAQPWGWDAHMDRIPYTACVPQGNVHCGQPENYPNFPAWNARFQSH